MKKYFPLFLVLILGLFLRIPGLSSSFWLDEAAQALESARPFTQQHLIKEDFQPPLFHYLIHVILLFSRQEWVLRLPGMTAGVLTIVLLYLLSKERNRSEWSWTAPFLLALSPMHVFLSQELRPYAFSGLFVTLSWYFLLSKYWSDRSKWVGFALTTMAGLYTLYIYPFFLLGQLLYILIEERKQIGRFILAVFFAVLCFLPWVPFFLGQLQVGTTLTVTLPGWSEVVATPQLKAIPLAILKLITGQVYLRDSGIVTVLTLLVSVFWSLAILWSIVQKKTRHILYWVVLPLVATWMFSFFIPVIAPKRLIGMLPGILLAVSYLMSSISVRGGKRMTLLCLTCLTIIELFFLSLTWTVQKYQREPWREVIETVQTKGPAGSIALFTFSAQFAPWDWYSDGSLRPWSTGTVRVSAQTPLDERLSPVLTDQRVYLFSYLTDLSDPDRRTSTWLFTHGWEQTDQIDGGPLGFIFVFDRMDSP